MGTRRADVMWSRLTSEAGDEEVEQAAGVSVAQASKELAAAGVDVAAERRRAEGLLAALEAGADPRAEGSSPVVPLKRPSGNRRPGLVWTGVIAAAAAAAIVVQVATPRGPGRAAPRPNPGGTSAPTGDTAVPAPVAAAALRRRAAAECDAGHMKECLGLLDRAAALDPEGEKAVEVRSLRARAVEAVRPK